MIWGTGSHARNGWGSLRFTYPQREYEIVAFIDNNPKKVGKSFNDIPIISPDKIYEYQYDYISIWSTYYEEIKKQLDGLKIPHEKIKNVYDDLYDGLEMRYRDCGDSEILDMLSRLDRTKGPWFYYYDNKEEHPSREVFYDEKADLFYILFEGKKKMYLTRDWDDSCYVLSNGKRYTWDDMWAEQDSNSPHLYEDGEVVVRKGDVLIDCGACEGNFTLHNIDKISKAYLIENNPGWLEALRYTFEPYKDKVIIVDKFVSDNDGDGNITIDTLVKNNKVDYIKMDIEGAEESALLGAKRTFENNKDIRCSICAYHKHGDEGRITKMLEQYGLKCAPSKGYMLFLCDDDVWEFPEFRRGVVRGYKVFNE